MKRRLRVYKQTSSIVNETAISMYERFTGYKTGFLLESYDKNYDRYTIFGAEPKEIVTSTEHALIIKKEEKEEIRQGNPKELLKEYYDEFDIHAATDGISFHGGLVGNLGYDFVRYTEDLPEKNKDEIGISTIQMMLMTEFFVVDYVAETVTAVVLEEDNESSKEKALNRTKEMLKTVKNSNEKSQKQYKHTNNTLEHNGKIVFKSDTLESYKKKVNQIKNYIREGHIFQTVLSQRWVIETERKGFEIYKELRNLNPSPYLYYFNFGDFEVIGSSPEMIVKQQGKKVFTCPIAGTRKRGKTEKEDKELGEELIKDEKECAEHVMLVDLARNDMGKISEFGTVKVTDFMEIQKYSHVMHIVSKVEGSRKEDFHPLDLAAAFLPAGTLSGAPKIRAMEIIEELEESKRGLYGGATGYIDFSKDMDLCITIRTMIKKNQKVYLQAGAGIVADSIPELEYEECCNKVKALASVLVKEETL